MPAGDDPHGVDLSAQAYTGDGVVRELRPGDLDINGMGKDEAKATMIGWLEAKGVGRGAVTYRLRDWLFSRQAPPLTGQGRLHVALVEVLDGLPVNARQDRLRLERHGEGDGQGQQARDHGQRVVVDELGVEGVDGGDVGMFWRLATQCARTPG